MYLQTDTGGYIGGILGSGSADITDCNNNGRVVADSYHKVGGIAGNLNSGMISNCINNKEIEGENSVAGIVGESWGSIAGCQNHGNVIGKNYVTGIAGIALIDSNTEKVSIENVENTGFISGEDYVAGIVGYTNINNVELKGTLTNSGEIKGNRYVAGIIALLGNYKNEEETPIGAVLKNNGGVIYNEYGDNLYYYIKMEEKNT